MVKNPLMVLFSKIINIFSLIIFFYYMDISEDEAFSRMIDRLSGWARPRARKFYFADSPITMDSVYCCDQ